MHQRPRTEVPCREFLLQRHFGRVLACAYVETASAVVCASAIQDGFLHVR